MSGAGPRAESPNGRRAAIEEHARRAELARQTGGEERVEKVVGPRETRRWRREGAEPAHRIVATGVGSGRRAVRP